MSAELRTVTHDDIMDMGEYGKVRADRRKKITAMKKHRRIEVGPVATFYFENYDTMWHQIHEMLFIERGGDEQIPDELSAYNPMIPQGKDLSATVMFEIDDALRRKTFLEKLGGVEETMVLRIDGDVVRSVPEQDVDRTSADGKASSVQFIHFHFTPEQIARFKLPGARIEIGIEHENYSHLAILPEPVRQALASDFI